MLTLPLCLLCAILFLFTERSVGYVPRKPIVLKLKSMAAKTPSNEEFKQGGVLFEVAERFGELTNFLNGGGKGNARAVQPTSKMSRSIEAIAADIRNDYENIFWATGNMDTSLWASNCTFADPFSSFGGEGSTARFKKNADNLGKLVLDPNMKITKVEIDKDKRTVVVGWNYRSLLKLPFGRTPVLAAAGATTHYLDEVTGLIIR